MPKLSFSVARFLTELILCLLCVTVVYFAVSSYYFSDIYTDSINRSLSGALTQAETLLAQYESGEIAREDLDAAANPLLFTGGAFCIFLGPDQQVLARTRSVSCSEGGGALGTLLDSLRREPSVSAQVRLGDTAVLMMGRRTENGSVLAGLPMHAFNGAAVSFRNRLLISMVAISAVTVLISTLVARRAARPARIITQMAGRITEGEQVTLPEDLPGRDTREIASALNYMSRSVAKAIGELKCEKESMSLILEGLSEGILAVDDRGSILHENAAAWELLGGEETPAYRSVMAALQEKQPEDQWDLKFTAGDRVLYCAISRLPREEEGASRGMVALIRDITEQERLERTRYDYVANISHELRTPLASIRGLGEGLRDGLVSEEGDRQRYYSIIVDEATRLSRLVDDLLELSSLQSNPAAFEMERIDPNELIYELHDRNSSLFEQKGIRFLRSLPDAPLPDIWSNEDRLSQTLTIFLDNARKYTPSGGEVILGAQAASGGTRFFVRDTGIGMDEETQRLAFDRFHQAERGRSDKGSGLGLSIAKEILEKMGLSIQLTSTPGQGSEFSFIVPPPAG